MKPLPFKIPQDSKESIVLQHDKLPHFYSTYHNHDEIQLTLIVKGSGTVFVGDRILDFAEDDVFLLGQNLPHLFKDFDTDNEGVESRSIFFLPNFMGNGFKAIPEAVRISDLLHTSQNGIRLRGWQAARVGTYIKKIFKAENFRRLIIFLQLLDQFSHFHDLELITSPGYRKPRRSEDGERINDVLNYLSANFHRDIHLSDVADVAHMSPTAFCRYLKQRTRKSYSKILNEIRIGQACKKLLSEQPAIGQLCYDVGFNNLSNFNRQFKRITGLTPTEYLQRHHG